jgi:hypothetical protein
MLRGQYRRVVVLRGREGLHDSSGNADVLVGSLKVNAGDRNADEDVGVPGKAKRDFDVGGFARIHSGFLPGGSKVCSRTERHFR